MKLVLQENQGIHVTYRGANSFYKINFSETKFEQVLNIEKQIYNLEQESLAFIVKELYEKCVNFTDVNSFSDYLCCYKNCRELLQKHNKSFTDFGIDEAEVKEMSIKVCDLFFKNKFGNEEMFVSGQMQLIFNLILSTLELNIQDFGNWLRYYNEVELSFVKRYFEYLITKSQDHKLYTYCGINDYKFLQKILVLVDKNKYTFSFEDIGTTKSEFQNLLIECANFLYRESIEDNLDYLNSTVDKYNVINYLIEIGILNKDAYLFKFKHFICKFINVVKEQLKYNSYMAIYQPLRNPIYFDFFDMVENIVTKDKTMEYTDFDLENEEEFLKLKNSYKQLFGRIWKANGCLFVCEDVLKVKQLLDEGTLTYQELTFANQDELNKALLIEYKHLQNKILNTCILNNRYTIVNSQM